MSNGTQTETGGLEDRDAFRRLFSQDMLDVLVKVGLIAMMVVICFRIFAPFMNLLLWGLILGVALYPLQQKIAGGPGGNQGRSAALLVLGIILLIGAPTVMIASSFATHIYDLIDAFQSNQVDVPVPSESVAEWPFVGERLYAAWSAAATDLPAYLETLQPQLGELGSALLSSAAGAMGNVLFFIGAFIVGGIMMAFGESGGAATERILSKLTTKDHGPRLHQLIIATIRSVATGVIGVAFIQALLLGVGFVLADIPAAGLLAIIVMVVGIIQLPAAIISLPAIGYIWWAGGDTTMNIVWSVYLLVAGMADNVLKPMLLGRGVEAPMPVILIGALGGMVSAGIVGLFIGAVALAVGYKLFMDWVNQPDPDVDDSDLPAASGREAPVA
ncbi:MAG: AI-2E family transporter [Gammaproteobacteria bacterium]|nr:MAG: AI-2E family transporter [Gammaproteobacteria bacterium]